MPQTASKKRGRDLCLGQTPGIHGNARVRAGVTLIELMVTVFLLTIGILSTFIFFAGAMTANQITRDMTEATSQAEYVLEEMRARTTLANITASDWPAWISQEAVKTLPAETITVTYLNPSADPLNVSVSVNWTRKARSFTVTVDTELTK